MGKMPTWWDTARCLGLFAVHHYLTSPRLGGGIEAVFILLPLQRLHFLQFSPHLPCFKNSLLTVRAKNMMCLYWCDMISEIILKILECDGQSSSVALKCLKMANMFIGIGFSIGQWRSYFGCYFNGIEIWLERIQIYFEPIQFQCFWIFHLHWWADIYCIRAKTELATDWKSRI